MNNKGQALIEFVLILPVFLFILFAIIDFGIIFSTKSNLENDSTDIISLYKNGTSLDELKKKYSDNDIDISNNESYYTISISTSVNLITPGFNRIFGDKLRKDNYLKLEECDEVKRVAVEEINLGTGIIKVRADLNDNLFYK